MFDPELLKGVFLDLVGENQTSWGDARLSHLADKLKLVDGTQLLPATDLTIEAELIALIYRYRWQIELFFKWLKSILGCRHLMAESPSRCRAARVENTPATSNPSKFTLLSQAKHQSSEQFWKPPAKNTTVPLGFRSPPRPPETRRRRQTPGVN